MMTSRGRAGLVAGAAVITALVLTGCARHQAPSTPAAQGPLEMPAVPSRVLAPVAVPTSGAEPDSAAAEPGSPGPGRHRPRPQSRPPEPTPSHQVPAVEPGPPGATGDVTPPGPRTVLQTPLTAGDAGTERQVREVIARARQRLSEVRAQDLGPDGRAQFDTAERLLDQAEDALKSRNYLFARYVADKADQLARGLGR